MQTNVLDFPSLDKVTSPTVSTQAAAYYFNRSAQTLRIWACKQTGPLQPITVNGRLAWRVSDIRQILGESN
jgi:hypothetical protein